MTDFFPGLEEHEAESQRRSEESYETKILVKVLSAFKTPEEVKQVRREAGDGFCFEVFNDAACEPPVLLSAKKLKNITIDMLLRQSFMRGPIATAYFDELANYGDALVSVGVIFPIAQNSNWIIYASDRVPVTHGSNYVERRGVDDAVPLRIVRLDAFISGLRTCHAL